MKNRSNILYKRSGVALIGIVLIMFLVFTILTVAAFNFAIQTLRIERWHVEYQEQLRLTYLARSTVNAVAEQLMTMSVDTSPKSGDITINGIVVNILVSGDLGPNLLIRAIAENNEGRKSTVSALYSTVNKRVIDWSEND